MTEIKIDILGMSESHWPGMSNTQHENEVAIIMQNYLSNDVQLHRSGK